MKTIELDNSKILFPPFSGMWKDRKIDIHSLRKKSWKKYSMSKSNIEGLKEIKTTTDKNNFIDNKGKK